MIERSYNENRATGGVVARTRESREKGRAMRARSPQPLLLLVASLAGCAARGATSEPPASPGVESPASPSNARPVASTGAAHPELGSATSRVPEPPLPGGEEPTPSRALPELRVEPLGMHIGGGTNTPEEKAPFHRALERKFPLFLECYRKVEEPWAGGSFGVDLKVARAGGAPQVNQPRTRIRGSGFQDCMLAAFTKVEFEKPKGGPTVLSYSVRFTLGLGKP